MKMPEPLGPRKCGQTHRALMNAACRAGHVRWAATSIREPSAITLGRGYLLDGALLLREAENHFSYKTPSAGLSDRATMGFPCGHGQENVKKTPSAEWMSRDIENSVVYFIINVCILIAIT